MQTTKPLIYAGIGSRKATPEALRAMQSIGQQLGNSGWHLRSGYAHGADMAFGRGAEAAGGAFTMFLPWEGYNEAPSRDPRFVVPHWSRELLDIAAGAHPVWPKLTDSVKCLMARNVCQVLGANLDEPATCVICWTPGATGTGGTGQAIRVAKARGIPVFDIASEYDQRALVEFVAAAEKEQQYCVVGELNAPAPNHFDPTKRGFDPR